MKNKAKLSNVTKNVTKNKSLHDLMQDPELIRIINYVYSEYYIIVKNYLSLNHSYRK